MLTSTASPSSFSFGGLSPQTQLENEKLSLQLQQGSPFVLTSELLYSQAQSLKSRMQLKNEDVYHKLEKLQELLTDALMDGKDKKEEKKENHAKLSIKIDADPSYYDKKTNRNSRTPSAPTLTTSIKHPFLSSSKKKKVPHRKSVRMIEEELQNKLSFYRCNPAHYEVFKNKIFKHKEEKKIELRTNLVSKNIKEIHDFAPEIQKQIRLNKTMKNQARSENVRKTKENALEIIRKKQDFIAQQSISTESTAIRSAANKNDLQAKWLILGSLASRISYIKELLIQSHEHFFIEKRRFWAARRIQRAWRRHIAVLLEVKKKKSLKIIGRVIHVYINKRREAKKEISANYICVLFKEMNSMGRLHKIIKKFRFQVVKGQRFVRNFIYVRKCQMYLLTLQWLNFEPNFFSYLNSESINSLGRSNRRFSSAPKKKKEDKKDLRVDITTFPDGIRESTLMTALIEKRKEYTKAKLEYSKKLELFHAQKKRKGITDEQGHFETPVPNRPILRILFNEAELKVLMKKAYDMLQGTT